MFTRQMAADDAAHDSPDLHGPLEGVRLGDRALLTRRWSVAVLIGAVLLCYGVVCTFGFTNFEDQILITDNANFNPATLQGLWNHWRAPHIFLYIPVTYTVWWLLALLGRTRVPDETGATLNPWLFHATNLCLHLICCLLVLHLLRRLLRGRRWIEGPSLLGALVFALHPFQAEPVAWTTGTKDVLCGAFSLAALLLYVAWAQDPHTNPRRRARRYAVALLALILALLSKPAACMVPLMMGVIDWLLIARPLRKVVSSLWPFFLAAAPIMLITRVVQPAIGVRNVPLIERPLVAADAITFYLYKLIWPFGMTIDYLRSPRAIVESGAIWWTWTFSAGVLVLIVLARRRWLTVSALLFLIPLLPVLGLTTFIFQVHSTVADRFMYLSMFGVALAIACVMSIHWTRWLAIGCGVLVVLLGVRCVNQVLTWRGRITLYSHALALNPRDWIAHNMLGTGYMFTGRYPEAIPEFARAIELARSTPELEVEKRGVERNLAMAQEAVGDYRSALGQRRKIVEMHDPNPKQYSADLMNLGIALYRTGHPQEALRRLEEAKRIFPDPHIQPWIEEVRPKAQTQPGAASRPRHPT